MHELCSRHLITGRVKVISGAALLNATYLVEDRVPPTALEVEKAVGRFIFQLRRVVRPAFPSGRPSAPLVAT
jgi:hypothetical protein